MKKVFLFRPSHVRHCSNAFISYRSGLASTMYRYRDCVHSRDSSSLHPPLPPLHTPLFSQSTAFPTGHQPSSGTFIRQRVLRYTANCTPLTLLILSLDLGVGLARERQRNTLTLRDNCECLNETLTLSFPTSPDGYASSNGCSYSIIPSINSGTENFHQQTHRKETSRENNFSLS